jgi:signal peptidase II
MNKSRELAIFALVVLAVTALDLGTKWWASANLATPEHPIPLRVGAESAGKTVTTFLAESKFPDAGPGDLAFLAPALETTPDGEWPNARLAADRGYFLFVEEGSDASPLFLLNPALADFYQRTREGKGREGWKDAWKERKVSWRELISEEFPFLSEETLDELLGGQRIHPVPMQSSHPNGETVLKEGDVLLLMSRSIEVVPGFYKLVYAENPGAAWGFLRDAPLLVRIIFLQLVSLLAMALILYVAWKAPPGHLVSLAGLAMIMGGAIGNFVGRITRHAVIDFLDMYIRDSHWPTYNVADIGITAGVALLFLQVFRKKSPF